MAAAWRALHRNVGIEVGAITAAALDRIAARGGDASRAAVVARLAAAALGD